MVLDRWTRAMPADNSIRLVITILKHRSSPIFVWMSVSLRNRCSSSCKLERLPVTPPFSNRCHMALTYAYNLRPCVRWWLEQKRDAQRIA
jgi:hypothetical protein